MNNEAVRFIISGPSDCVNSWALFGMWTNFRSAGNSCLSGSRRLQGHFKTFKEEIPAPWSGSLGKAGVAADCFIGFNS